MTVPAKSAANVGALMESVLIKGDLASLSPKERTDYYLKVCETLGLNPLTRPFEYITLNGKLTLYAKKDCTDQLRKINSISLSLVSQDVAPGDIMVSHARAKDQTGREDEDIGAVSLPDTLKGENRANQIMKGVTKAKRRVTLSICGLGFLDETEVDDIPGVRRPAAPGANVVLSPPRTPSSPAAAGEQPAPSPNPAITGGGAGTLLSVQDMAREAAMRGEAAFKLFYSKRTEVERAVIDTLGKELRELMDEAARET